MWFVLEFRPETEEESHEKAGSTVKRKISRFLSLKLALSSPRLNGAQFLKIILSLRSVFNKLMSVLFKVVGNSFQYFSRLRV